MYETPDIPLIRVLFSRAIRVTFGFSDSVNFREPFVRLYFDINAHKIAAAVFEQIVSNIGNDYLRLSFYENAGEFLTLSFLWQQYPASFSSAPDEYPKKEYLAFIKNTFYNDPVKLYFCCTVERLEIVIAPGKSGTTADFIPTVYYQRIP